jgi:hypothetical protein
LLACQLLLLLLMMLLLLTPTCTDVPHQLPADVSFAASAEYFNRGFLAAFL